MKWWGGGQEEPPFYLTSFLSNMLFKDMKHDIYTGKKKKHTWEQSDGENAWTYEGGSNEMQQKLHSKEICTFHCWSGNVKAEDRNWQIKVP